MTGPTRATRRVVATRDGGCCVVCGRSVVDPETLVPHLNWSIQHRVARGMGGSKAAGINTPVNLLTVCGDGTTGCHGRIEAERDWARHSGFAVSRWRDPADVPVRNHQQGWVWVRHTGYIPLTTSELWLLAGQWLDDEMQARGITTDDDTEVVRLSQAAAELFGVMAGEARREVA